MKLFADGPTFQEIKDLKVDGYTFNPSLYKKLGAKKKVTKITIIKRNIMNGATKALRIIPFFSFLTFFSFSII